MATSLLYALIRPYKKLYMNVIECLLYFIAGMLLIIIIHNNKHPHCLYDIILATILMPSVIFAAVVTYKTLQVIGIVKKIKKTLGNFKNLQLFKRWIQYSHD